MHRTTWFALRDTLRLLDFKLPAHGADRALASAVQDPAASRRHEMQRFAESAIDCTPTRRVSVVFEHEIECVCEIGARFFQRFPLREHIRQFLETTGVAALRCRFEHSGKRKV